MGAFQSQLFDGDVAIDLYRSMPDREIVFWVRQAVNLTQGWTFVQHAMRIYPRFLEYECRTCRGSGIMTCPHCQGNKIKPATGPQFKLSRNTEVGKLLAAGNVELCQNCGDFCEWDHETDWGENWEDWERKLAFYDRSYGPLLDEWYEYYLAGDQLEKMEADEPEDKPDADEWHPMAQVDRDVERSQRRLDAIMDKYEGHPYDTNQMVPYGVVDPNKHWRENLKSMVANNMTLPPELDVSLWPEFLVMQDSPLTRFDEEIACEYLIQHNLMAALTASPKPVRFAATAGTVPCRDCGGQAWERGWFPNMARVLQPQEPLWLMTLKDMADQQHTQQLAALSEARAPGAALRLAEHPRKPPLVQELSFRIAESELQRRRAEREPSKAPEVFRDLEHFLADTAARNKSRPSWEDTAGLQPVREAGLQRERPDPYPEYDPLNQDPARAMNAQERGAAMLFHRPVGDLSPSEAQFRYRDLNPLRALTRKLRDMAVLGEVQDDPKTTHMLERWLNARQTPLDPRVTQRAVILDTDSLEAAGKPAKLR